MAVVIIDVCPKCRGDVSRRLGLIKTPLIACRRCGYEMRVTPNAVRNNWQYNFAMGAGLFIWFVFACIVLLDPRGAMDFAARFGKSKGLDSPWLLAFLSFVPAFLAALPVGLIGRIVGIGVARKMLSDFPEERSAGGFATPLFSAGSASESRDLQAERWMPTSHAPPPGPSYRAQPSGGGIGVFFLRIVAAVVWMVAFFVVGSLSISAVVMALEQGDQEARQKAVEAAGRAGGVPLFFGSIFLVILLAILGWLPGVRRRKASPPASDAALPRSKPPDSRLIIGR